MRGKSGSESEVDVGLWLDRTEGQSFLALHALLITSHVSRLTSYVSHLTPYGLSASH